MAGSKPANHIGDREINNSPFPAEFLKEESLRGRLPSGALVYPRPQYTQPDTGAHNTIHGSLDIGYDIAARPMHVGNQTTDLNGGYYPGTHSE
jgi:hypothetical protein